MGKNIAPYMHLMHNNIIPSVYINSKSIVPYLCMIYDYFVIHAHMLW